MNPARLRAAEEGFNGIARKVLHAMPFGEPQTIHTVTTNLMRSGCRADKDLVEGCLRRFYDAGLCKRDGDAFIRIQYEVKTDMPKPEAAPDRRIVELVQPEADPVSRMSAVGTQLRRLADEVDSIALAMLEREQGVSTQLAKVAQLREILSSLGGAA